MECYCEHLKKMFKQKYNRSIRIILCIPYFFNLSLRNRYDDGESTLAFLFHLSRLMINSEIYIIQIMKVAKGRMEELESDRHNCLICFCPYNQNERKPLQICSRNHIICKQCAEKLRSSPKCPFCKEDIKIDQARINLRIYSQLPYEPVNINRNNVLRQQANNEIKINNSSENRGENNIEINRGRRTRNERVRRQRRNASDDDYNRMENEGGRGGVRSEDCIFLYTLFFIFCLLLPMRIFSLVLAKTEPTSACLDDDLGGEFTIRSWLEFTSILQFILICSLCSNVDIFGMLLFLKQIVEAILGIIFFVSIISISCSSTVYTYGLLMTIFQGTFLLGVCCGFFCL